jgi:hypothetical protein
MSFLTGQEATSILGQKIKKETHFISEISLLNIKLKFLPKRNLHVRVAKQRLVEEARQ